MVEISISSSLVVYKPDFDALKHTVLNLHIATLAAKLDYDVTFTLTIVDNSCDDIWYQRIRSWVETMSANVAELNLSLLRSPDNIGYGRGNNLVIEKSQSKYHLVINPDLFVAPDALGQALAFMEANPDTGLLSPSVFGEDGLRQYLCKRNPTIFIMFLRSFAPNWVRAVFQSVSDKFEMQDKNYDEVIEHIQYPTGCIMFFRTKPLKQIHGFDPDYFLHYEDADIGRRMLKVARVVYVPSVKVTHMWARDTHRSWKMKLVTIRSGFTYWRKWGGVFKSKDTFNCQPQNLALQCKIKREYNHKILLTGSTGFIGRPLYIELISQGYDVSAAIRSKNDLHENVDTNVGVFDGNTDWSMALQDVHTVIHLAARVHVMHETAHDPLTEFRKVNVQATLHLAQEAVRFGVRRFIFISSIGVNGNTTLAGQAFTADDIPSPHDNYSISKLEAEEGLRKLAKETGLEVVIIRPPLVYGLGVKANFKKMMQVVKSGIPLPLGAIYNQRSFVYVGNLVSLIIRCIDHPAAANEVFLVSDGNDISTTTLLRGCATALGVRAILLPAPQQWIEFFAGLVGKSGVAQRLCGNLQVDISKAKTLLGWTPPITVVDGLKATAAGVIDTDT